MNTVNRDFMSAEERETHERAEEDRRKSQIQPTRANLTEQMRSTNASIGEVEIAGLNIDRRSRRVTREPGIQQHSRAASQARTAGDQGFMKSAAPSSSHRIVPVASAAQATFTARPPASSASVVAKSIPPQSQHSNKEQ
jgi:hypothetical protein